MNRRRLLTALAGGVGGGLAGCTSSESAVEPVTDGSGPNPITGADGRPADICQREPKPGRIPAIVEPSFAPDWSGIDRRSGLDDGTPVIGIQRDGDARAYPVSVLLFEIVNDTFDVPVLVTYCPLCSSGLTAIRRVAGRETTFENTSYTWRPPLPAGQDAIDEGRVFGFSFRDPSTGPTPTNDPNLVMFDRATGSYWSQLLGQAICGPLTGERLTLVPSTVTDWRSWRERHPDTTVLLPPPHSRTVTG